MNSCKHKLSHAVDVVEGEGWIAEMWHNHFKDRFNYLTDSRSNVHLNQEFQVFEHVSAEEICTICKDLVSNKASGEDKIPAEVYKFGSVSRYCVLA